MNTKHCSHCHKLLRAEAEICSRCGLSVSQTASLSRLRGATRAQAARKEEAPIRAGKGASATSYTRPVRKERSYTSSPGKGKSRSLPSAHGYKKNSGRSSHLSSSNGNLRVHQVGRRSIPPASPHRAGHYSGLHPEDQPYQSTVMATVQRPPAQESHPQAPLQREPARILLPAVAVENKPEPEPDYEEALPSSVALLPPPPLFLPKRPLPRGRFVPTALTLSFLIMLVAGSLVAYAFINKKTFPDKQIFTIQPDLVRVNDSITLSGKGFGIGDLIDFTHDMNGQLLRDANGPPLQTHADDMGTFTEQVTVPTSWEVGQHLIYAIDIGKEQSIKVVAKMTVQQSSEAPPLFELSSSSIDLGVNTPGGVLNKTITLINAGGRHINWQASSDRLWLTVFHNAGTFSGRAIAEITGNGGTLLPGFYLGHVIFSQPGISNSRLTLTVAMTIKSAPPANLVVSPTSLAYSGTSNQNLSPQTITLQNNSGQALHWSSNIGNNASWLSIYPSNDHLRAHASETVTVNVQSQQLAQGLYQGIINFKGGANPQVTVALNIAAPGNLTASPPSLNFASIGQNPANQSVTIQNSGGTAINWTAMAATADGANWLSASPSSGILAPNSRTNVTVSVNALSLNPRAYQGTLSFNDGGQVSQLAVSLTVAPPPTPTIVLSQQTLDFATIKGTNPAAQSFAIKNTGNATLHWAITEDQNGATYAPISSKNGSLSPGQSTLITVTPNVTQVSASTLTGSITVLDSDGGTKVTNQKITVNIIVKDQAVITLSSGAMSFAHDSTTTSSSQLLTITNTGSQSLNWVAKSSTSWLSSDTTSGTLAPGASITIDVQCDSSTLTPGTYPATFVVSDSDTGTPVISQTVVVTLVVGS